MPRTFCSVLPTVAALLFATQTPSSAQAANGDSMGKAASRLAEGLITDYKSKGGDLKAPIMLSPLAGDNKAMAQRIGDALRKALVSEQGIPLVDREALKAAMNEAALGASQGADDSIMQELAGALGAQALIHGDVIPSGADFSVSLRIVSVQSGQILASAKGVIASSSDGPSGETLSLQAELRRLSDKIAASIKATDPESRYKHFAVMPLKEVGEQSKEKQLGTLVAAEVATRLAKEHGLMLVERSQLDKVIGELSLGQTGLLDPSQSAEVGKLAGAQRLVMGTVSEAGDRYLVNLSVVSTENGQVMVAEEGVLPAADLIALSADAVVLRSTSGAIYRSILLPGWGQFYNRQSVKGGLFVGAEVLAFAGALFYNYQAGQHQAAYDSLGAGTPPSKFDDLSNAATDARNLSTRMFIALGIIHGLNILDAWLSSSSYDSATPTTSTSVSGNAAFDVHTAAPALP